MIRIDPVVAEQDLNVGVINPFWLPTLPARFKVRFDFVDDTGCVLSGAGSAVYLTHVVVDDREIHAL